MKASIVGAVLACSLLFAPLAHADTSYVPIGDPYTDTLQLWSGIATALSSLANDVAALFNAHQFATAKASNYHHAPKQLPTAMVASAALGLPSLPVSTTVAANEESAATATTSPQSRSPPTAGPSPVIYRVVQAPAFDASAFVTRDQFNAAMAALGSSVQQLLAVSQSTPLPQNIAADGNATIPDAAENNISNLSGVTITNANLTASEIPDLSGTYLSLNGGAVSGTTSFANDVGIGTTSPSDVLAVNGPIFLANVSPTATSNRLYSNSGSLYWNGSLIGGGSVGNWTTDGINVWRTGGNVGIGTTSPGSALSVAGSGYFTSGLVASGNTTLANATSSTLFSTIGDFTNGVTNSLSGTTLTYTNATTTNATTTNLSVSGNATLANLTSAVLGVNTSGQVVATSSIGTNLLTGTLGSINGTSLSAGGTITITAASSTLLTNNNTFSGTNTFSSLLALGSGLISNASSTFTVTLNANTLNLTNALGVASGGTGISSTPSYGQLLVGNGTNYTLTATSSLGLPTFANLTASIGAGYPFSLTGNATSTLTQFNGGLTAYASSTIGNGTQSGGITISGGATTTANIIGQGTLALTGTTGTTTIASGQGLTIGNSQFVVQQGSGHVGIGTTTPGANLVVNGTTGQNLLQIATSTNQNIFTVNQNGSVGIGTASPGSKLDVVAPNGTDAIRLYSLGQVNVNPPTLSFFRSLSSGPSASARFQITGTNAANADFDGFYLSSPNSSVSWLGADTGYGEDSGNGTSWNVADTQDVLYAYQEFYVAEGELVVGRDASAASNAVGGTIRSGEKPNNGSTNTNGSNLTVEAGGGTGSGTPGDLLFATANVQSSGTTTQPYSTKMIVKGSGNVGIGTANPYSLLQVTGPDTASTSAFAVVNSASTTVFSVFDDGNSTYSGSIFQSSDERLKTDVQSLDASSSLSAIELLNPVSYLRLDQPGTGENLGFIAQQVQQVFPQLVSTTSATALTPGGTLTLNYEGLISPIVSAIQALSTEFTSLAQSITTQVITAVTGNFSVGNFSNELCVGSTCVTPAQFQAMVAAANGSQSEQGSGAPSSDDSQATDTPPVIQINGDNPAMIQVGAAYNDLGATITGPQQDLNLGIQTYVNGIEMSPIQIDTSTAATDTVDYVATDQNGLTATSTRMVIIEAPANDNQATSTPANDNSPPPAATSTAATTTAQ